MSEKMPSLKKGGCIEIDGKIKCYTDTPPKDKSKCVNLSGLNFCEIDGENGTTVKQETRRFFESVFYPKIRTDESKLIEDKIVEFTLGAFLGALIFVLSLYIKDIIDLIIYTILPIGFNIWILIAVVLVLLFASLLLSILEYRILKANRQTRVWEKLAEKTPSEMIDELKK